MSSKYTKKVKVETKIGILLQMNNFIRTVEFEGNPSNHFKKALSYNMEKLEAYANEVDLDNTFKVPELYPEFQEKLKELDKELFDKQISIQDEFEFKSQKDYEEATEDVKSEYDAKTEDLKKEGDELVEVLKEEYKETISEYDLMVTERDEFLNEDAELDLISTHIDKFPECLPKEGVDQWLVWRAFNLITFDPAQED